MSTFRCPHCSDILSAAELKEGWCEKCGKHVPEHLLSAAAKEDRLHRHEHLTHKQAPLPHVQATPSFLAADNDFVPVRPMPTGVITRTIGILLALIALGTMLFPWGYGKVYFIHSNGFTRGKVNGEQTGLQMLYGGITVREGDDSSSDEAEFANGELFPPDFYTAPLIFGFPLCLFLAIGSLALLDPTSCWRWAGTWATLAAIVVLVQFAVGFPTDHLSGERYWSIAMWVGLTATSQLVMLAVWPMAPSPEANESAWAMALPLLGVVGLIYGSAFAFPTTSPKHKSSNEFGNIGEYVDSGATGYTLAYHLHLKCWYANPVAWLAAMLLFCRRWPWAALAGTIAVWLGFTHFMEERIGANRLVYTAGYWMWLGSFSLLTVGSLAGWAVTKFVLSKPSRITTADSGEQVF